MRIDTNAGDSGCADTSSSIAANPYACMIGSGGIPGVMFSGSSGPDYGSGQASGTKWAVRGSNDPGEAWYHVKSMNESWQYYNAFDTQNGIIPVDISSSCGNGGQANCALPSNLNDSYSASGTLTIGNNGNATFNVSGNTIILVKGYVTLEANVVVPVGSSLVVATTGRHRV